MIAWGIILAVLIIAIAYHVGWIRGFTAYERELDR